MANYSPSGSASGAAAGGIGLLAIMAIVVGITVSVCSYTQVETGDVAVMYLQGKQVGQLEPGAHFINPLKGVKRVNVQLQHACFSERPGGEDEQAKNARANCDEKFYGNINAGSKQAQDVYVQAVLNFKVDPTQAPKLLAENGGDNWFSVLIPHRMTSAFKAEISKYEATDMLIQREKIRTEAAEALRHELQPYGILVESIQITNLDFNAEFKKAIEDKQIITQQAQGAQNRVAIAEAEARERVARAQGEANAAIATAEGTARANRLVAESLTTPLLQQKAIDKFDAIKLMIVPEGSNFLLDPTGVLGLTNVAPAPAR